MEPKLRFKEFSGDWIKSNMNTLSEEITVGIANSATHAYREKGVLMFRNQNIKPNFLDDKDVIYIDEEFEKKYKNKRLKPYDLLIARTGYPGTTCVVPEEYKDCQTFTTLIVRLILSKVNPYYICQYINSPLGIKYINSTQIGGGQKNSGAGIIKKMPVSLPSLPEQTKIADFLSTVDEKIQNQQDKITHLENIKKGFMQKIFSRKIRFKDANGNEFPEWEEKKLEKILEEGSKKKVDDTSKYKKITVKLNLKGLDFSDIKRDMVDKRPFYIRYKNEIIIGKQNYFNGSIAIVEEKFDGCICSNAIMSFKVINENLKFVYFYLSQSSYIAKNAYLANGTGQKELTEKDFLNMYIELPCLEEQQKIANFLSSFDEKIDVEKNTLEHLKELKKGLLQQMFV